MESGSPSLYLVAILVAYFIFVFIGKGLNPFVKPKFYVVSLSRWRFARTIAAACLVCTWIGLFVGELLQISLLLSVALSTVVFGLFWIAKSAKRRKKRHKLFVMPEEMNMQIVKSKRVEKAPNIAKASFYSSIDPGELIQKNPVKQTNEKVDYKDNKKTEEYEPGIELATAQIPSNLTDLDLSIAETEFESLYANAGSGNALIDELATLKVAVKSSQAAAIKSEAVRDHAIFEKNKALKLAAMERKKRRITEVRASKVIMKHRQIKALLQLGEYQALRKKATAIEKSKAAI